MSDDDLDAMEATMAQRCAVHVLEVCGFRFLGFHGPSRGIVMEAIVGTARMVAYPNGERCAA